MRSSSSSAAAATTCPRCFSTSRTCLRGEGQRAATWWESADETVFPMLRKSALPEYGDWLDMCKELAAREIGEGWDAPATAQAFYERHNEQVRREAPADRLLDWQARDGWEPLCRALGVPVPDDPFPRVNTREEWRARDER